MPVLSNPKHERFAQELAQGKSASAAYEAAGFAANTSNAARLNANERVRARVEELLQVGAEKAGVTIQAIVEELAKIGFATIGDYVDVSGDAPAIALQGVSKEKLAALSEITTETVMERAGGEDPREVRKVKIKLWDKPGSLEKLGRHLGMFKDKIEVSGPGGGPVETISTTMTPKQAAELYARTLDGE